MYHFTTHVFLRVAVIRWCPAQTQCNRNFEVPICMVCIYKHVSSKWPKFPQHTNRKKRDRLGWWPRGCNRKHTEITYQEYSPLIRVESTCLATPCLSTNDVPVLTSCIQICVGEYPWISRYLIPPIFSYAIHLYMENGWAFPSHISKYDVYIYIYVYIHV
jgi:hypothetical protein